jgi:hypothetical protein
MKSIKFFPVFIACSMFLSSCFGDSDPAVGDPLYESVPNISICTEGSLSSIEQQTVWEYINSVRKTHKLRAVEYNSNDKVNANAQKIALYGAANATASGAITESELCYPGFKVDTNTVNRSLWGSATSKWTLSEYHVNDWMMELNSDNINNRRRLLDPFLKSVTFGRVIGTPKKGEYKYVSSAALLTNGGTINDSTNNIEYIAYPIDNYSAKLFDPNSFLSFSVLYDKRIKLNNGSASIDLSNAKIEVSAGTQQMEIVEGSFTYDYNEIGLPNNLQWKVLGLTKNVTYTVKISDVKVKSVDKTYEYTFSFK